MEKNKISKPKTNTNLKDLEAAFWKADLLLSKHYLTSLNYAKIIETKQNVFENNNIVEELNSNVRFFDITQVVINKNENVRDKLVSVFNAIGTMGASIIMLVHSDGNSVSVSFGIKTSDKDNIAKYSNVLKNSFIANFPGTKVEAVMKPQLKDLVDKYFPSNSCVSSVTDIPGIRSKEENKDRQFVQGIEKLIDAMQGKIYTLALIADPISLNDMKSSRVALENLYSSLVPFSEEQITFGENETEGVNNSIATGTTNTINESITNTISHTIGKTKSSATTKTINGGISVIISLGAAKSKSETEGSNESDSNSKSKTEGTSKATSQTKTTGTTKTLGTSKSYQIKIEDHRIKRLLSKIEQTLERYDVCADIGMWNCAMYCISENEYTSQMAASIYHSIIRGEKSSLENSAVISWDFVQSKKIVSSLKYMEHPFFNINELNVTPGTLVSSSELTIQAGLPNHSVPGLAVVECAEFGRTVSTYDSPNSDKNKDYCIHLGNIYHMHNKEDLDVKLNPNNFSSHTFITGSTGSGKSNTVYNILNQMPKIGVNFLVIEPAKGEYKNIFGKKSDVSVYGTNPQLYKLLKINPFSFPKQIHVLEHIDRLIEIFNVCWPMYAAMPAVLKESIERAYEDAGWNLTKSKNDYGEKFYPTFADITRNIKIIIDSSEYDTENKGAYKGSLITRLKSLTNGINGQIFTNNEISNENLFDKNVIVDLSRVGSLETKSLIMGLLVLKLQEYRLSSELMNSELRHVTVIEEAHNLLKRTSTEQSQESGNLLGKSVEMLTNSIAEMRTYGEGFIIADQAPGLLDLAVIRNTNTKIILRLPDQSDRELVGKSANLNDKQIEELAKLPKGVAAVYQNEWIEPVLCKVSKADVKEEKYDYKPIEENIKTDTSKQRINIAKLLFSKNKIGKELYDKDLREIGLCASTEIAIRKILNNPSQKPRYTKLSPIIKELFPTIYESFKKIFAITSDVEKWTYSVDDSIKQFVKENIEIKTIRDIRQCIITQYVYNELSNIEAYRSWREGGVK